MTEPMPSWRGDPALSAYDDLPRTTGGPPLRMMRCPFKEAHPAHLWAHNYGGQLATYSCLGDAR